MKGNRGLRIVGLMTIPALALGLWVAGNAVAVGENRSAADQLSDAAAAPPEMGIYCGNPDVRVKGAADRNSTWQADVGQTVALGDLAVDARDAKIDSIQMIVGDPDLTAEGAPLVAGRASLSVEKTGEFRVYALVRYRDCRGRANTMAEPIGYVAVAAK